MTSHPHVTGERIIAGPEPRPGESALIDVQGCAELLQCSTRHIYRLSDSRRMPPPVRLGALVRWDRRRIEEWIADGCPRQRPAGRGGAG